MLCHFALAATDPEIHALIVAEERRQADKIRMIASENYVSQAVLDASGTVLQNKYSEGYPRKRYYEGQQNIDPIEELAQSRARAFRQADVDGGEARIGGGKSVVTGADHRDLCRHGDATRTQPVDEGTRYVV